MASISGHEHDGLLKATLDAYSVRLLDDLFAAEWVQKWDPEHVDPKERRRRRRRAKWKRLKGWRLVFQNKEDYWHKGEECEW